MLIASVSHKILLCVFLAITLDQTSYNTAHIIMDQKYSCLQFHVFTDVLGWLHGKVMVCHRASLIWNRTNQTFVWIMSWHWAAFNWSSTTAKEKEQTRNCQQTDVSYFHSCKHGCKGKPNSPPSQEEYRKKEDQLVPLWHQHVSLYSMSCKLTMLIILYIHFHWRHSLVERVSERSCVCGIAALVSLQHMAGVPLSSGRTV